VQCLAGPSEQSVRPPAVAGLFYPDDARECAKGARSFVQATGTTLEGVSRLYGAVVPHAGWICSGAIAGQAIGALSRMAAADLVVVFGAVHTPMAIDYAALDIHGRWQVPGQITDLATAAMQRLTQDSDLIRIDPRLHVNEHAVEVELPLLQAAWPSAKLLPIEVPLIDRAVEIGQKTAQQVLVAYENVVFLASSDLTHYGPSYGFAPAGVGATGLDWAMDNDRRLLELLTDMSVERIVPQVRTHRNACGGGAIAAMLAACQVAGARRGYVLRHANSAETLASIVPQPTNDAVGYAAVVIG
jgi:MEMO1 family protein